MLEGKKMSSWKEAVDDIRQVIVLQLNQLRNAYLESAKEHTAKVDALQTQVAALHDEVKAIRASLK
jgi:polyhydroxyalkanoate synthesis regulator phasin